MTMLSSRSPTLDDAADLLFREQCRRQLQRTVEARMKYGFCRVSRPGLDTPTSRVFPSTLTDGPFDLDIVFAPDGIENYVEAKRRSVTEGIFPVANIRDIIASKKASNRINDRIELYLLDLFRIEYESRR